MLNSDWLDIAIGVIVVWFLFALAVSAVNEGLVKVLALRSKQLWSALRQMLDGTEDPRGMLRNLMALPMRSRPSSPYPAANAPVSARLYATATLQALELRSGPNQKTRIDNIPASVFSHAVLELAMGASAAAAANPIAGVQSYVTSLPPGPFKAQLQTVLASAGQDIVQFRDGVEHWFDGQMSRLSRLYRAQVHIILLVVGLVIAAAGFGFGLRSNALQLASDLQHDQDLRTALVAAASQAVRGDLAKAGHCDLQTDPSPAACQLRGVSSLKSIDFALRGDAPSSDASFGERLGWILPWRHLYAALGVVITGIAISMGASFWFAILKRLVGLRGSGSPPAT